MSLARFIKWAALNLQGTLSRRRNYLFLTPPSLRRQLLYGKRSRNILRVEVRDRVDLDVLAKIFRSEDYNLARLRRWRDIDACYQRIAAAGEVRLIVDCGANIGASALYFAEQFARARVLALEPQPGNFEILQRNCAGNPRIVPLRAAVASEDKRGALVDPGKGNWGFRVSEDAGGEVEMLSLNGLIARDEGTPFVVKIDIEGYEAELFSRNLEWLDRFYVLVIELHDWMLPGQRSAQSFLRAIAPLDRDFLHVGENVISIANR